MTRTEGFSFTFEAPLKTSTKVMDNSDTDIDESSDSEAPLKPSTSVVDDSDTDIDESSDSGSSSAAESSLAEVQKENNVPMSIDTSNDEEEKGKMTSLPSTTVPEPMLK